jgi:hypothetical protein
MWSSASCNPFAVNLPMRRWLPTLGLFTNTVLSLIGEVNDDGDDGNDEDVDDPDQLEEQSDDEDPCYLS